jgi:DNA-binding winged helix-turn-helix (wHTH) protein
MGPREQDTVWKFREFELDEALCELRRAGRRVPIQRKPYQLLLYLIGNRHRVVTRGDLLRDVWQGVAVSDSAFASALRDLRRAVGDSGRASWAIETIHGFGYRFVARVDRHPLLAAVQETSSPERRGEWRLDVARRVVDFLEHQRLLA